MVRAYPNTPLPQLPDIRAKNLLNLGGFMSLKGDPSEKEDIENYLNSVMRLPNSSKNEDLRIFFMV